MFLGTFTPKLDAKGRFFLPAKYRSELEDGLVISRGYDRCLTIWPKEAFKSEIGRSAQGASKSKKVRNYERSVLSGASDEMWDDQGRVLIPATLRNYAGLKRDLVVNGTGDRVEIWDAEAWESFLSDLEEEFANLDEDEEERGELLD